MAVGPSVFDQLTVLADPTRARLLVLLEQRELSVSELCAVVQLPQSTVSRHLKVLTDDGWVACRADGAARHYRQAATLPSAELWGTVRDALAATDAAREDARRLPEVLAARASRS